MKTSVLQFLEQRDPVHSGTFHSHSLNAMFCKPPANRLQIHSPLLTSGFLSALREYTVPASLFLFVKQEGYSC